MTLKPHQRLSKLSPKNLPLPPAETHVSMSFKTYPGAEFCLSECSEEEVREALGSFKLLTSMTWAEAHATGGRPGKKVGIGYTQYADSALVGAKRPSWLGKDVNIIAIRASQKFRIFGYRSRDSFYVLWFDKDHLIVPSET